MTGGTVDGQVSTFSDNIKSYTIKTVLWRNCDSGGQKWNRTLQKLAWLDETLEASDKNSVYSHQICPVLSLFI